MFDVAEKETALHVAVNYSQTFSVMLLMVADASVAKTNSAGRTPLHLAAALSHVDIVTAFLQFNKVRILFNYLVT